MAAKQHPKKQHPKKETTSPNVSQGSINQIRDYYEWYMKLPEEAKSQLDTDAANLIKEIQGG